ncbi:MAG: hypothetical protein GYB66_12065 [Chloroflexi bacterium]|nr:hypothetical protein [Chloroflexota bacterium]
MNVPQHWRLRSHRYQLCGKQHEDGSISFPPRPDVVQREIERYEFTTPVSDELEKLVNVA